MKLHQCMGGLGKAREQRIGLDGYCAILRSVYSRPQTGAQLAERFGIYPRTMHWICASLHRAGLIHRSAWVKGGYRQKQVPVWAYGLGGDVDHTHWRPVARKSSSSAVLLGAIRDALEPGPMSSHQLAEDIGFTRQHMRLVLRTLKARRLIRVGGWEVQEYGVHVALMAFGTGPDAPRVARIGRSPARVKVYRQRHEAKKAHLRMLHLTAAPLAQKTPARCAA